MCNHEIPYKTAKYKHQLQPTIVNLMLINIHSLTVSHHRQLALLWRPYMTTDKMCTHAGALLAAVWAQHIVWFFLLNR